MRFSRPLLLLPAFPAVALLALAAPSRAEEAVRLREEFPAGYQYHVSTRVDLSGSLTLPAAKGKPAPKPLTLSGDSAIEYDERILAAAGDGTVDRTARIYRRCELHRTVGGQPQQSGLRPEVRRLVVLRRDNIEVPFSPDGPLLWGEIDLIRTDVFTPALAGLLPDRPVVPGDRWPAQRTAIQELTDLEHLDERGVECRLDQVTVIDGRRHARVTFSGRVRGTNEDGPNRQQLDGYLFFDLESPHLSYLSLKGINFLLDKDGKEAGRVEGQFVLTRRVNTTAADLSAEALRGVVLEPNDDNTRLLYDNPTLGVRFLYPRRWRVAGVHGRQVGLDGADGSGILLTVEPPARVPTGVQFLAESRTYLEGQKAKVLRADPPRALQGPPQELEQFGMEVEVMGQRVEMDYYVARQSPGGVTLAARLLPRDLAAVRKEVEGIARSLTVTRAITDKATR
jgi:hypothetical protein